LKKQDLIFSACKKLALPENRLKAKGWKWFYKQMKASRSSSYLHI
jgi:hypothetical protein